MQKVTSKDVAKSFGRFQDMALVEPVAIQKYGRDSVVMISAREYERLRKRDRMALTIEELSESDVQAISEAGMDPRHAELDELMD